MEDNANLEDMLMRHLSHPNIDKSSLRNYSLHLANNNATLKWERIWWIGTPWPEILNLQSRFPIEEIENLEKLFSPHISSVEVFPLGIPYPIELQAIVKIPLIATQVNEGRFNG